jgi:hypothetical protein
MNRRKVLIGTGAVAMAVVTGAVPALSKYIPILEPEVHAYTVYRDYDEHGNQLHWYRGRSILVSQDLIDGFEKTLDMSFEDLNKQSIDEYLSSGVKAIAIINEKSPALYVAHRTLEVTNYHKARMEIDIIKKNIEFGDATPQELKDHLFSLTAKFIDREFHDTMYVAIQHHPQEWMKGAEVLHSDM